MAGIYLNTGALPPVTATNSTANLANNAATSGKNFAAVLADAARQVTFSKHAMNRLQERGIDLSTDALEKLDSTVERMAQKGARESLIYMDDIAMVVSVANRKVITAMDGDNLSDNIFTNIDSAAILK